MRFFQVHNLVTLAAAVALIALVGQAPAQRPVARATRIDGRVVRVVGPDRFVVRGADNREVILHAGPKTRFLMNNRAARFADLREGVRVVGDFDVVEGRNLISAVTLTPAAVVEEAPPRETVLEGTIVRVLEPDNQFIVLTPAGREVTVFAQPRTTFMLDNRAVRLADLRRGANVRVQFDLRNQRHFARTVVVAPRRPR
jgi:hypothetical protein